MSRTKYSSNDIAGSVFVMSDWAVDWVPLGLGCEARLWVVRMGYGSRLWILWLGCRLYGWFVACWFRLGS